MTTDGIIEWFEKHLDKEGYDWDSSKSERQTQLKDIQDTYGNDSRQNQVYGFIESSKGYDAIEPILDQKVGEKIEEEAEEIIEKEKEEIDELIDIEDLGSLEAYEPKTEEGREWKDSRLWNISNELISEAWKDKDVDRLEELKSIVHPDLARGTSEGQIDFYLDRLKELEEG